jgi:CBS domain-containing protein
MTQGAECVGENESMLRLPRRWQSSTSGRCPICGEDGRLKGMLTDRDVVIKVLAKGKDPSSTTAGGAR